MRFNFHGVTPRQIPGTFAQVESVRKSAIRLFILAGVRLPVCEADPAIGKKLAFKFRKLIEVQRCGEINVPRVPGLRCARQMRREGVCRPGHLVV
jgi:hypothetical protein